VNILLDTCTLIWLTQEPEQLSENSRTIIEDSDSELMVSHASVWEMLLKIQAGKFSFPIPLRKWLRDQQSVWNFRYLNIGLEHLLRVEEIEHHHSDPFDRLLVTQAIVENVGIVTPDPWIAKYPVQVLW
jgi:PIN domain nuclease of toxin-antitoxin system